MVNVITKNSIKLVNMIPNTYLWIVFKFHNQNLLVLSIKADYNVYFSNLDLANLFVKDKITSIFEWVTLKLIVGD